MRADNAAFNQDAKCLGADLVPVVSGLASPPCSFCRIQDGGIVVTVKNQGLSDAGAAQLRVTRDFNILGLALIPPLGPQESVTLGPIPLTDCCEDQESIQIFVDSNFAVDECNENNNVESSTCAVDPDSEDLATRVVEFMQDRTDGNVGVLLKEIGGPVRAAFNETTVFEPASSIKVLIHLHGMLQVQSGLAALSDPIPWLADMGKIRPDGTYQCGGNDCYADNTVPRLDFRAEAHRLMMECSDNALTQALRNVYGDFNIDNTAQLDLGLSVDTQLNHSLGCAPDAAADHNQLTLADLALLHEQVATGLLTPGTRADFYDLMRTDKFFNNVIDQEAVHFGLTPAEIANFKSQVETAWKGGSYDLSDGLYRSRGGWLSLPFACEGGSREYFFGAFIDQASKEGLGLSISEAVGELLRDDIRAALASCDAP